MEWFQEQKNMSLTHEISQGPGKIVFFKSKYITEFQKTKSKTKILRTSEIKKRKQYHTKESN